MNVMKRASMIATVVLSAVTAFGFIFFAQVPDAWSVLGFVAILVAAFRM